MTAYECQDGAAADSSHNLGYTDGAIKQAKVGTHVSVALQGIGDKGERHGEHGSPRTADEQERNKLELQVVQERHHGKTYTAQHEADAVSHLDVTELR